MWVQRKTVEVVLVGPASVPPPDDQDLTSLMREALDVITPQEFDTVDDHPCWDIVAVNLHTEGGR